MSNKRETENVKRNYEYLGDFHLGGTQLRVSDPSYEKDTWCSGVVENCQPGTWAGYLAYQDEEEWGLRVCMLVARNKKCRNGVNLCDRVFTSGDYIRWNSLTWEDCDIEVGVDSGQAGIFDEAMYKKEDQFDSFPDWLGWESDSKWYANCCAITLSNKQGGVIPSGVLSASGYGDGSYRAFKHKNRNGQVDMVLILFM